MPESSRSKHRHRLKKTVRRLNKEISTSQVHRHRRHKITVKRFPMLSDVRYAKHALACCEEERGKGKFEVVEASARRILLRVPRMEAFGVVDWCHVSFIAKTRKSDGSDASEFFFFVELGDWGIGVLNLMRFRISQRDDSDITYGCGFCPGIDKKYPHLGRYSGGSEKVPTDAVSQKEMARCFKRQLINSQVKLKPKGYEEGPVRTYFCPVLPNRGYAEIALKHIHSETVEYEIGQTYEACVEFFCSPEPEPVPEVKEFGEWCHVSFLVKPRNDVSEKLIFAELMNDGKAKWIVHSYCLLDPDSPDIAYGCGFCPGDNEEHPHPADACKYTAGHWPYMKDYWCD